jgi:hypothetical protein
VTLFSERDCEIREVSNIVSRPAGVTIIALLAFFAASILALGACIFLVVGIAGMIGTDSGEPLSVAIAAMGVAGSYSLLVLSGVAAFVANGVLKLREWARVVSIAAFGVGILSTIFSLFTVMGYLGIPAVPMILCHLSVIAITIWLLSYLLRPTVKQAFSAVTA